MKHKYGMALDYEDDGDFAYDSKVDGIITADFFEKCPHKNQEDDCEYSEYKTRCWHMGRCPIGNFGRRGV